MDLPASPPPTPSLGHFREGTPVSQQRCHDCSSSLLGVNLLAEMNGTLRKEIVTLTDQVSALQKVPAESKATLSAKQQELVLEKKAVWTLNHELEYQKHLMTPLKQELDRVEGSRGIVRDTLRNLLISHFPDMPGAQL
ncbi:MAG: hypothetical protein M1828_002327 [Chrysothrix sp. TS-e1954]|nr:MAG: hypothetical protein M1828_002327 [Chrysothrix sp. TS-e1954]